MSAYRLVVSACAAFLLMQSGLAGAQVFESREFDNPENARRYKALISELRCLVCQNQNLADSNAALAADLRQLTYDMIREGKSDAEIVDFMVQRYGDFVLYRPPLKPTTVVLWAGPFVLLAFGLWLLLRQLRRRASATDQAKELSAEERTRFDHLMGKDETGNGAGPRD